MIRNLIISLCLIFPSYAFAASLEFSQVKTDEQTQIALTGKWDGSVDIVSLNLGGKYVKSSDKSAQYDIGILGKLGIVDALGMHIRSGYSLYHTHQSVQAGIGLGTKTWSIHSGFQAEYPKNQKRIIYGKTGIESVTKKEFADYSLSFSWKVSYVFDKHGDGRYDGESDLKLYHKWVYLGVGFSRVRFVEIQRTYIGVTF